MSIYPDPSHSAIYHWPTDKALELLHGPGRCETCDGRGWVAVPDPLFDDALVDERCPTCARKARAE